MKKPTIGIIGCRGKYGAWFYHFFKSLGYTVIGADKTDVMTKYTNEEVVQIADIVVFAVKPMRSVPALMTKLAEHVRDFRTFPARKKLWIDITGLKSATSRVMKNIPDLCNEDVDYFSIHPMSAPPRRGSFEGQVVIVTEYPKTATWQKWAKAFLKKTKASVVEMSPEAHDEEVGALVQAGPHADLLIMASLLRTRGVDVKKMLSYSSPFYKTFFALMARILSQDPHLYAEIQMDNPAVLGVLDDLEKEIKRFKKIVAAKNRTAFVKNFLANRKHFGKEVLDEGYELFEQMNFGKK
jgi:prephenate dehydrogenase